MLHIRRIVIISLLVCMLIPFVGNRTLADTEPCVLIHDEVEYWEFVENTDLPEDFVCYSDDWSVLGTFAGITSYDRKYRSYWYYLTGKNNIEICLSVYHTISPISKIEVPAESNLLFNSDETATWVYCQVGKMQYYYLSGKLSHIQWFEQRESGTMEFILKADFDEYPREERDLCSLLLSLETAEKAGEQLISIINGENKGSVLWLWIALPVGAAVIAGGAAFVLLRKKRKHSVQ